MQFLVALSLRQSLLLLGLSCALALAGAYTAEYGFGLLPCDLCLMQRKPFFAVIGLSFMALLTLHSSLRGKAEAIQKITLLLIALLMLGNSGLALYHTGVEQKWWQGPAECSGGDLATGSIDDIRAQIMAAPLVRCDVPAWEFHGITMASLNIVFCATLALFAFWRVYATTKTTR